MLLSIDFWLVLEKTLLILGIVGLSFFIAMYTTYAERKVAAEEMQMRRPM